MAAALSSTACIAPGPARSAATASTCRTSAAPVTVAAASSPSALGHAPGPSFCTSGSPRSSRAMTALRSTKAALIPGQLDEEASLKKAGFSIPPEDLIEKAKAFLAANNGVENPDLMADDFAFVAPVVGPLPKEVFLKIFGGFGIKDAFSDASENYFGFTVDPIDANRVWFMSRFTGTHDGTFANMEATGKKVELVPTMSSVIFNEEGKVVKFTTGYPVDKDVGNSGGLSLAFGLIYALNPKLLKFPEAQPSKMSWQMKVLLKLGQVGSKLGTPKNVVET